MPAKSQKKTVVKNSQSSPTKTSSPPEAKTSLALSDIQLKREHLTQEKQWLLKQITRKQKELSNFVEQMREIATEIFQGSRERKQSIKTTV